MVARLVSNPPVVMLPLTVTTPSKLVGSPTVTVPCVNSVPTVTPSVMVADPPTLIDGTPSDDPPSVTVAVADFKVTPP
jgi:hypothetical protein